MPPDVYRLPVGTVLKHGTRSGNLRAILSHGLQPQPRATGPRSDIEPAPILEGACYVGWFSAYFGAYAAWCELAHRLYESMSKSGGRAPAWFALEFPVVVSFRTQEPVELRADEDYLNGPGGGVPSAELLQAEAESVWTTHRSGAVRGLPASWIEHVELADVTDVPSQIRRVSRDAFARLQCDLYTLAFGVVQTQQRLSHDEVMERWTAMVHFDGDEFPGLSKRFAPGEVGRFVESHPLRRRRPKTRQHAAMMMQHVYAMLTTLSPELGISAVTDA